MKPLNKIKQQVSAALNGQPWDDLDTKVNCIAISLIELIEVLESDTHALERQEKHHDNQ